MEARSVHKGHGWWPYLGPYLAFLLLVELGARTPETWAFAMLPLKVVVPAAVLLHFARQGAYPELRSFSWDRRVALDVLLGLAVTALWMAPTLLLPALRPEASEAFDPDLLGEGLRSFTLGVRLSGFALVTPFVEELFVRSFLLRYIDVFDTRGDFRRVPIGRFAWRSFLVTVLYFTFSHVSWEWGVAAATGVIYNLWLYRRRHLMAVVIAHATTNASLFLAAALGSWWYFL